jgi:branched-chain amino acid transport system permease protein
MGGFFALALLARPVPGGAVTVAVAAVLATAALGVLVELVAYRPIRTAPRSAQLISALGMLIVLNNVAMLLWGSSPKRFPSLLPEAGTLFGLQLPVARLAIIGGSLALMLVLSVFIYLTKIGAAMRASTLDMDAARLMGIDIDRVISATFAIGSGLAAAAGILVGSYYNVVVFNMGDIIGLKAFVAAILGGIGNIPGAMVGGLFLGMAETVGAAYISSGYKDAIAYVILILVLLVRPGGILGAYGEERA